MAAGGGVVGGDCTELTGVVDKGIVVGVEPEFAIGRQRGIAFPVNGGGAFGVTRQCEPR